MHYATSRKVAGSISSEVIGFFNSPNSSSRTMALGSTQPLREMSTRNFPGGKKRPARKADSFSAIYEPTVWKMWEPRRLTTLWASTACYMNIYFFLPHEVSKISCICHLSFIIGKMEACPIYRYLKLSFVSSLFYHKGKYENLLYEYLQINKRIISFHFLYCGLL
jgi:hypothetical protein